jgi:hypothetical protein
MLALADFGPCQARTFYHKNFKYFLAMTCYFCIYNLLCCGSKSCWTSKSKLSYLAVDSAFQLHLGKISPPNICKNKSEKAQSGLSKGFLQCCFVKEVSNSIPSWKGKYSDHVRKDDRDLSCGNLT